MIYLRNKNPYVMYKYMSEQVYHAIQKVFYTIHVDEYNCASFQYNCAYINT